MKKILLIQSFLFFTLHSFGQNYFIEWNKLSNNDTTYKVRQIDLNTGGITDLGHSSMMDLYYNLDEVYYDKTNNQLVGLYSSQWSSTVGIDLWKYDLTTNTDQVVDLGIIQYDHLIVTEQKSYITSWNSTNSNFEIKEINLNTGVVTNIGSSTTMTSDYDLQKIYYDKTNNQLVGLYQSTDLWKYNLTTNTDQILDLGSVNYEYLTVSGTRSFLTLWNSTNSNYEIKEINPGTGVITNVGSTTAATQYSLYRIYFDEANNQLVGIFQNFDLWKYNLNSNTDQVVNLPTSQIRDLAVYNSTSPSGIVDPTQFQQQDEIVKIYDALGNELTSMESDKMMIVKYKSGKVRKVYIK
jgi:hypothetical protein